MEVFRHDIEGFIVIAPEGRYDLDDPFYVKIRKLWYPPIEEQLDMQIKGTWAEYIAMIKTKVPKGLEPQDFGDIRE